jgi:virginiamycin B lyase
LRKWNSLPFLRWSSAAPAVGLASPEAQQVAITDYQADMSYPGSITWGPDGALWFTSNDNAIGRMTAAGAVSVYSAPDAGGFGGITRGPDGALWFTESDSNNIGRMTTAGAVTTYAVPTSNSNPSGITQGPDGALWFTGFDGNKIGRITTAGQITGYPVLTASSGPFSIATGPDGALWFTERAANRVGRMTTTGVVREYVVPDISFDYNLWGITAGPDGVMWFADYWAGNIDRITMTGVLTEYHISTYASEPVGITPGPDGALWFTESFANRIGRITTAGVITDYQAPQTYPPADQGPTPNWITLGPDGALWFTDYQGGRIGETVLPTASLTVNPSQGAYNKTLTFTGSAFAPNEAVVFYNQGIGSAVLATVVADSTGAFTAPVRVPQSIYGPRIFLCAGKQSKLIGAANSQINPRLILNSESGPAGSSVAARGFGLFPNWTVNINWNGQTSLGAASTNSNGTFAGGSTFTFTVPQGTAPGVYSVTAGWYGNTWATASFIVNW